MVATISPAEENYGETLSTLRYASRAKNIVNKPIVNEDDNVRLIRELKSEIKRLKAIITDAKLDPDQLLGDSTLEQNMHKIHKKEEMIAELTKNWAGKWDEDLQRAVEERNLAWHSEGIKMTVGSEKPHLFTENDAGKVVIYQLKNGSTTIGTRESSPSADKEPSPEPDIVLSGEDIEHHHCSIVMAEQGESKVRLVPREGKCFINHMEADQDTDLSHGDLLQLGRISVFRFNHPEEAKSVATRNPLLPLSPMNISNQEHNRIELEEQKEALERDFNQKVEQMREEMERKNEEERAKLIQEMEELKQQIPAYSDRDSSQCDSEEDVKNNSAYDLMQSIAYTPITARKWNNASLADRVVVGRERDSSLSPYRSTTSADSRSFEYSSSSPDSSPSNRHRKTTIVQDEIDDETMDISIVDVSSRSPRSPHSVEMGFTLVSGEGEEEAKEAVPPTSFEVLEAVDSGAVFSTSTTSTPSIETCSIVTDGADASELQLKLTQEQLREKDEEFRRVEREKEDMKSQLSEAEKKTRSLRNHLSDQQIQYQSEHRQLLNKVDELQEELFKRDMEQRGRARSNAFSAGTPDASRRYRSQSAGRSLRQTSRRISVEIPGCLLRGDGWSAYHVFEVRLNVGPDKWSVFKSYQQFKLFHEDITRRYSQLSVLTFPPSKWFGVKNKLFVEQRRNQLQAYMQSLVTLVTTLPTSPLYEVSSRHLCKDKLVTFNAFFSDGSKTGL